MELINRILGLGAPRRYFGGNSGYVGYSKSKRAVAAEERGLRSKSQMNKAFADSVNAIIINNGGTPVTLKNIKDALPHIIADEWHHTSMYGNKTDYYSPENIAEYFSPKMSNDRSRDIERKHLIENICKKIRNFLFNQYPNIFSPYSTPYDGNWRHTFIASNGVRLGLDNIDAIGDGRVRPQDFAVWINGYRYRYGGNGHDRETNDAIEEFWKYVHTIIPSKLPSDILREIEITKQV